MEPRTVTLLRELVAIPGPSGYEARVRAAIRSRLENLGLEPAVDDMGNLYVEIPGEGRGVLLAAHMDEIGLVVTHIEDNGLLRFSKLGGIDDRILPSTRVTLAGSKGDVPGVIGITPPHLQLDSSKSEVIPTHRLAIDIGASSREEALDMGVDVLTPAALEKPWVELGRGRLAASRSIDDRAGCAVLLRLAERIASGDLRPKAKVILAWTVQEEVGLRGALGLARRLEPSLMVAVDTVSCCEPVVTGRLGLGGGAVIRAVDRAYIAGPELVSRLEAIARSRGIPVQKTVAGGGTDAAAFQRAGVRSVALGLPVRYTHSTVETFAKQDLAALEELAAALVEEWSIP